MAQCAGSSGSTVEAPLFVGVFPPISWRSPPPTQASGFKSHLLPFPVNCAPSSPFLHIWERFPPSFPFWSPASSPTSGGSIQLKPLSHSCSIQSLRFYLVGSLCFGAFVNGRVYRTAAGVGKKPQKRNQLAGWVMVNLWQTRCLDNLVEI